MHQLARLTAHLTDAVVEQFRSVLGVTEIPVWAKPTAGPRPELYVWVRSDVTRRQELDGLPLPGQARTREESRTWGIDLDRHDRYIHAIPRPDPGWAASLGSLTAWLRWELAKIPAGYRAVERCDAVGHPSTSTSGVTRQPAREAPETISGMRPAQR